MKQNKCPICGCLLDESNDLRCLRFPICIYQQVTDKTLGNYIMYDLETTGLTNKDHFIEIGAIYVEDNTIVDSFSALCNPGIFITQRIVEITGITNKMLSDKPPEYDVVKQFVEWCNSKETSLAVGQNINSFDNRMLKVATKRFKLNFPFERSLDTLKMAINMKLKEKGLVASNQQSDLGKLYGIEYVAHRAINDVEALYQIFEHLKKDYNGDLPILNIDKK